MQLYHPGRIRALADELSDTGRQIASPARGAAGGCRAAGLAVLGGRSASRPGWPANWASSAGWSTGWPSLPTSCAGMARGPARRAAAVGRARLAACRRCRPACGPSCGGCGDRGRLHGDRWPAPSRWNRDRLAGYARQLRDCAAELAAATPRLLRLGCRSQPAGRRPVRSGRRPAGRRAARRLPGAARLGHLQCQLLAELLLAAAAGYRLADQLDRRITPGAAGRPAAARRAGRRCAAASGHGLLGGSRGRAGGRSGTGRRRGRA